MRELWYLMKIFIKILVKIRIIYYKMCSNVTICEGRPVTIQPVFTAGAGRIFFGKDVHFGVDLSPFFYNGYCYVEARCFESHVVFGDNVRINNNFTAVAYGSNISIGNNVLIGHSVEITSSDFHGLEPLERFGGRPICKEVVVCDNVFIGNGVRILRGVHIGKNSVVASGAVVSKDIPANVVAGGIPAKVIRRFEVANEESGID